MNERHGADALAAFEEDIPLGRVLQLRGLYTEQTGDDLHVVLHPVVDLLEQGLRLEAQTLLRFQFVPLADVADEGAIAPRIPFRHGPHDQLTLEVRAVGPQKSELARLPGTLELAGHMVAQPGPRPVVAAQRDQIVDRTADRFRNGDVELLGSMLVPFGHPAVFVDLDEGFGRGVDDQSETVLFPGQRLTRRGALGIETHGMDERGTGCGERRQLAHVILVESAGPVGHTDHADEFFAVAERDAEKGIHSRMPVGQSASARVGRWMVGYDRFTRAHGCAEKRVQVAENHSRLLVLVVELTGGVIPRDVGDGVRLQVRITLLVIEHLADETVFALRVVENFGEQAVEHLVGRSAGDEILLTATDDVTQPGGGFELPAPGFGFGEIAHHAEVAEGLPGFVA